MLHDYWGETIVSVICKVGNKGRKKGNGEKEEKKEEKKGERESDGDAALFNWP